MTYTPVELRHVRVGRSLLGYNRAMVEEMIEEVAESFEATWRERGELADRVEALEKQIAELRGREELLTRTLVAAEQAASDVRQQARSAAEAILNEARQEAQVIVRTSQADRERLVLEARRIEGMLRAALVMVEEGVAPASPEPALPPPAAAQVAPAIRLEPDAEPEAAQHVAPAPKTEAQASADEPGDERQPAAPAEVEVEHATALLEPQADAWPIDETGEFRPVRLPPLSDELDPGRSGDSKPLLRRLAGGSTRDFDWGD